MKRELIRTKDNSYTLFVPELNEHYHSTHGALAEAEHIFIGAGLKPLEDLKVISILEIGFGSGLNACLTALYAEDKGLNIFYQGLEKYPVAEEEWRALNYPQIIKNTSSSAIMEALHAAEWEEDTKINSTFQLLKSKIDFRDFRASENSFDLIYFDAFAPSVQADLWELAIFKEMYKSLKPGGRLVTYCVKGSVRRTMKEAGFSVEKIPGPLGKREIARALKLKENHS
jgi:tRNA U34 5-methylaminomethyl-2-thiouridine-forming methyltransferase MnmC